MIDGLERCTWVLRHVKEPRTLIAKEKELAPLSLYKCKHYYFHRMPILKLFLLIMISHPTRPPPALEYLRFWWVDNRQQPVRDPQAAGGPTNTHSLLSHRRSHEPGKAEHQTPEEQLQVHCKLSGKGELCSGFILHRNTKQELSKFELMNFDWCLTKNMCCILSVVACCGLLWLVVACCGLLWLSCLAHRTQVLMAESSECGFES